MKIKALHIASFGGLKNKELYFDKPFSVVYGDNENGKTTVMSFIKMMFYGSERATSQLSKNIRKKYTPWDNSAMAGSIDFELDGKNYRIERQFGNSNSTDKVTLINLDLGTRETVSPDVGVNLLSLSPAAFERSIFIGQFGFPESNSVAEGELNSKLSNITLTGDESVSFDEVKARLEGAKYALMSKRGNAGEYDKNAKCLKEIEEKLKASLEKQQQISLSKENARKIIAEIENLQQRANTLSQKIEKEQDFRNAEKLKELLSLKAKLDDLNKTLTLENGQLIDENFVRKVAFCLSKIENSTAKITAKENENKIIEQNIDLSLNPSPDMTPEKAAEITEKLKNLEQEKQDISSKIILLEENQKNLKENGNKKISLTALITGIILLIAGVFSFTLSLILGGVISILGLASICLSFILKQSTKNKNDKLQAETVNLRLEENRLLSLITTEKANLTAINTALNSNSAIIEKQKEQLEANRQELNLLTQEKSVETDTLLQLFARYKPIDDILLIKEELSHIEEKATRQKELKQNINYILKDIGNISYDTAKEKLEQLNTEYEPDTDFNVLKTEYQELQQSITDKKTAVAGILAEVKAISKHLEPPECLISWKNSVQNKMNSQKDYCDTIDIALSVLEDSFVEMRRSYSSVFEKKASNIFNGITGGNYKNMTISKSFDIAVEKTDVFGSRELDYLSSGTADQAYLSLRLALSQLIAQNSETLPILLDDSLAQYDDMRTDAAIKFLSEYSQNNQIIMFTCHKSISDCAKKYQACDMHL